MSNEKNYDSSGKLLITEYQNRTTAFLLRGDRLVSVKVYSEGQASLVGNIYVGKVDSIAANIQAAFVRITQGQVVFLPMAQLENPHIMKGNGNPLRVGDEILVQITREAAKTKQPTATHRLALSGMYCVVSDGSGRVRFSDKLSREIRDYYGKLFSEITIPQELDVIVRTNAADLTEPDRLFCEIEQLQRQFLKILETASTRTCYSVLYEQPNAVFKDLEDYKQSEYHEIITDIPALYQQLVPYVNEHLIEKPVRLYQDSYPLKKLYKLESGLQNALNTHVWLKSGAYLVIEPTESLTAIDVNTGKYIGKTDMEETYLKINREAAREIACQLRLRNLSGMILVDFINMKEQSHKDILIKYLRDCVKEDPVKTVVVDMTELGLIEITRKRVDKPLRESISRKISP